MRFILIIGLTTVYLPAQSVYIGVKGGVPLTPAFDAQNVNPSGQFGKCGECATERTLPYVVGPALEMHLRGAFSLGLEALYSRADYNDTRSILFPNFGYIDSTDQKHLVDRWEIPILLKVAIKPWREVRPFIAGGVSFQYNQDRTASGASFDIHDLHDPYKTHNSSTALGSTFGVGASFGSGRIRPSLELRYTRWNDAAVQVTPRIPTGLSAPPYARIRTKCDCSRV
jgi:Outer membrane protein beta-barrel domain